MCKKSIPILFSILLLCIQPAVSRDLGQWGNVDKALREWYQALTQPDVPSTSCCGAADAFWADEVHIRDGKVFAVITDDREDAPRGRPHIDIGTEIEIPPNKMKWTDTDPQTNQRIARNMDGHGIVFISRGLYVFCYIPPGGV